MLDDWLGPLTKLIWLATWVAFAAHCCSILQSAVLGSMSSFAGSAGPAGGRYKAIDRRILRLGCKEDALGKNCRVLKYIVQD